MFRTVDMIIDETKDYVVLNKPSGLLTIPDRFGKEICLKKILEEKYGKVYTVHRIDRETSGIVVFALNESTHQMLSQQFEKRETVKIYFGLVTGKMPSVSGRVEEPIAEHPGGKGLMVVNRKGKESITEYELQKDLGIFSWVKFHILTGRTHQIRVHMKHIGHPIVCDSLYGDETPVFLSHIKPRYNLRQEEEERPILSRLALHASKLEFKNTQNHTVKLEAPLPKDLKAIIQQLEKIVMKKTKG